MFDDCGILSEIPEYFHRCYTRGVKIGVSLPAELLEFADAEARRRKTTRSGLLAELLEEARVRAQARAYLDRHGWDVAEDESAWRAYQSARMALEYAEDDW